MQAVSELRRSLGIGLAAAIFCTGSVCSQNMPLEARIKLCGACHGEDGNSRTVEIPSLAGQPELFLLYQLVLMREGVRRVEPMVPFIKGLEDAELESLAKHFAQLPPISSEEPIDPTLAKRGTELAAILRCSSCHLPTLAGQQQIPRLAKQRVDYLIASLKALRDNQRSGADTQMTNMLVGISNADLTALAHYAASR